jgi:hypothetical protein
VGIPFVNSTAGGCLGDGEFALLEARLLREGTYVTLLSKVVLAASVLAVVEPDGSLHTAERALDLAGTLDSL